MPTCDTDNERSRARLRALVARPGEADLAHGEATGTALRGNRSKHWSTSNRSRWYGKWINR